jgi:AcrR family transcriptional regulator
MCEREGMAQRYHHGDLRRQLLVKAGEVLEQDGPEGITLRGLARSLGVSHAAPGYHFSDRDALLIELAAEGHEMLEAAMSARLVDDAGSPPQLAIGEGYLDFALSHPNRFRLMFAGIADMSPSTSPTFTQAAQRSFATLVQVTSQEPGEADPRDWLSAWALVHGLATLWVDGSLEYGFPRQDPAAFRAAATAILADHGR